MTTLDAYLEIDDDGVEQGAMIWVPSLPGFFVRGRSEDEALARLRPLARRYIERLGKEGERFFGIKGDGQPRVRETHHDASQGGNFFEWDLGRCTKQDLRNHLSVMRGSRSELEHLVESMPPECQDWKPVPYAPRSPKLIALHIAATEVWYLNQFFGQERVAKWLAAEPDFEGTGVFELDARAWHYSLGEWYRSADMIKFMRATRNVFEKVVKNASEDEVSEVVSSRAHRSEEQWTLRKVLRRAAWHEAVHVVTVRRYIRQFRLERRPQDRPPSNSIDQRKLRDILSWKTERVQLTASSIHLKDRPIYSKELIRILSDETKDFGARRAAADALNFVGDARISMLRPEMVKIPASRSVLGISEKRARQLAEEAGLPTYAFRVETPEHEVKLSDYRISRYPITNMEYLQFVTESGGKPPSWWSGTIVGPSFLPWKANHPVWGIGWDDAMSYCRWLSKKTGVKYRLPTENEWEKASRGTGGRD